MSTTRVRLSSQTRETLAAVALLAVIVVLCLALYWLAPLQLAPPAVR